MRRATWIVAGAVALLAVVVPGAVLVRSGGEQAGPAAASAPVNTAKVERGALSDRVSQSGVLTFRARPDGSPYAVINQAAGVYTALTENGGAVGCGGVLYRVDQRPVLLLCGPVPAYRGLHTGDTGPDVRALNRALHVAGDVFTAATTAALEARQRQVGARVTGSLALADAVILPEAVRIAKVDVQPGGPARPGTPVLSATSETPEVQLNLDPSQQDALKRGDRAQVTLPDNTTVAGRVDRIGAVVRAPAGQDGGPAGVTIPVSVRLDDPGRARGLDQAPVQVDITTTGVADALSVPVTALVGTSGDGFAVEVVRADGRRELVAVQLGLFDSADGRVQVDGELRAGDDVVVPSP